MDKEFLNSVRVVNDKPIDYSKPIEVVLNPPVKGHAQILNDDQLKPVKDTILIQAASGIECIEMLQLTQHTHEAYCKKWGIEARIVAYPHDSPVDGRHPMWLKVHLIREALEQGWQKVIWLDADTLIVDDTVDLRDGVPENAIGATYHRMDWDAAGVGDIAYDHFCAGALYVANTPDVRTFIDEWWGIDDGGHPWHDQHSFNNVWHGRLYPVEPIDARWNSIVPFFISDKPVVKAWHGFGQFPERLAAMKAEMVKRGMIEATPPEVVEVAPAPVNIPVRHDQIAPILSLHEHARQMQKSGQFNEARAAYERMLASDPFNPEILYQLCEVLGSLHEIDEAERVARRAIAHSATTGVGYNLLAGCLTWRGKHEEAGAMYEKALALSPDMPMAQWNYALNLLLRGDYQKGFWIYKWGSVIGHLRKRTLKPEWDGSRIEGETLHIWAEQGYGDALMMARLLPLVRQVSGCAKIILECHDSLVGLFVDNGVADEVYELRTDGGIPWEWDEHISMMSLPRVLGMRTDCGCLHARQEREGGVQWVEALKYEPYLHAEPLQLPGEGMLRVGVCYRGSSGHTNDRNRSTDFELWQDLLKTAGCAFFNLDKQTSSLPLIDWAQTARFIASMDLVITVDTAVAHLAGAMGKEVWLLLPFVGDWRWGYKGDTSPWYPNTRLFRQGIERDWKPVMDKVHEALFMRSAGKGQEVLRAGWQSAATVQGLIPFAEFEREAEKIGRAGTTRHTRALYGLIRWLRPQSVVEVGTWHGYTAMFMARAIQENGSGELRCIDDFSLGIGASNLDALQSNVERCMVGNVMAIAEGNSTDDALWPERVDFAYIDGDHSLEGAMQDVQRAIDRGAQCIVLHDTTSWWGPRSLVEFYLPEGYQFIECTFDEGLAILMKKAEKKPVTYSQKDFPTGAIEATV